ncbi:protein fantom isoform 1-T1 [Menidia menidia]
MISCGLFPDMSSLLDDTAADVPVKDISVYQHTAAPDVLVYQHARTQQDVSRVSREELEDRFLRLSDEALQLKQHVHKQDEKIRKLGTKLMRLVKDRTRMEQLVAGGVAPRVRDVEQEELVEELQERVRSLQADKERLAQRLLVARQQLSTQTRRPPPVQPRGNTGLRKLPLCPSPRPRSESRGIRSLDGGRPPTGQLPRYGHSLLEEARTEIRNLENVIESQRSQVEELEGALELQREELRRKEAQFEQRLLQVRQEQSSSVRSQVGSNVSLIRLQKQLADRSNSLTELEGRFLVLHQAQQTLKASHDAAMSKVDELSAQLKAERLRALELEERLQGLNITKAQAQQLQEQVSELQQENDQLAQNNQRLLDSAFEASQQQRRQVQEQQLRQQVAQLETALKADLEDKNHILDKIQAERERSEQLAEDNSKLKQQVQQQQQQLEEQKQQLQVYSRDSDYSLAELTEALLHIKQQKAQRSGELGFLEASGGQEAAVRELRAAHAETIQELEKTRSLLSMESQISRDYKTELEAVLQKTRSQKLEYEQKLQRQAEMLDQRAARVGRLEAQLRDVAYGTRSSAPKPGQAHPDPAHPDPAQQDPLGPGENVVELQLVGARLSPAGLRALGDAQPSTFCTYCFYMFEPHSTPVAAGHSPQYGFTSRYRLSVDQPLLDYLQTGWLSVELHQALGLDWRTLARGRLRLQPLLGQDGRLQGSIPLAGPGEEAFGSVDVWLRLQVPLTETLRRFGEQRSGDGTLHAAPSEPVQLANGSRTQLVVTVCGCSGLRSRTGQQPSPYVVYKFFSFPDQPSAIIPDCCQPDFSEPRSYPVLPGPDLDQYLRSEELQFYVFDAKEEQLDAYLGKASVPLLPLASKQPVSGVFELRDHSGLPAGLIEVALSWGKPPTTEEEQTEEPQPIREERTASPLSDARETPLEEGGGRRPPQHAAAQAPPPRPQRAPERDAAAKRVTFRESTAAGLQGATKAGEEEEEESHVSEGQLVPAAQSCSDGSDISEDIPEDVEPPPAEAQRDAQSDSDDCIVQGPAAGRKAADRLRLEVVSLSLRPDSRPALDPNVVRLFVEFCLLDLPTEETPLSLPKPPPGRALSYHYSKVIPVDAEHHAERRRLLRDVLRGGSPQMERIKFTVVSEPPEEEEQERECEDVGVASLRIQEVLDRQQDMMEASLSVWDVADSSQQVGTLTVTLEGLQALRGLMEDQDLDLDQDQD